jgi:hypothetical protein
MTLREGGFYCDCLDKLFRAGRGLQGLFVKKKVEYGESTGNGKEDKKSKSFLPA